MPIRLSVQWEPLVVVFGGWLLCLFPALAFECVAVGACQRDHDDGACQFVTTSRVTAQLPLGLRIVEIRAQSLLWKEVRGQAIDLHACKPTAQLAKDISLDEYLLDGTLKIRGAFQATGRIRYEPNDGGDLFFFPDRAALRQGGRFFRDRFSHLKLDGLGLSQIAPPKHLVQSDCWEARVTIKAIDLQVVEDGSSKSGTYPEKVQIVSSPKRFTRCAWGR